MKNENIIFLENSLILAKSDNVMSKLLFNIIAPYVVIIYINLLLEITRDDKNDLRI